MDLNQEFLIEVFYSYCKRPLHKKYQNVFNSECPICKEGKSIGRSRRLFYFPSKQYFYCHNCAKSWRPLEWVKELTGLTFPEIIRKNNEKIGAVQSSFSSKILKQTISKELVIPDLPENYIEITADAQNSAANNKYINLAIDCCKTRRLFTATNTCRKFFISLDDKVHKNRLIIPFYDLNNKIVCYQTRALTEHQFPKYLTKFGEKSVFGINNIDDDIPYIFVFEGPIDSMFVKNGVAIASINPTRQQEQSLSTFIGKELIYVFDNDKNNKQVKDRVQKHINDKKRVFVWPAEFKEFKDLNEVCCKLKINEVNWNFIVKNSFKGSEATLKYTLSSKLSAK